MAISNCQLANGNQQMANSKQQQACDNKQMATIVGLTGRWQLPNKKQHANGNQQMATINVKSASGKQHVEKMASSNKANT